MSLVIGTLTNFAAVHNLNKELLERGHHKLAIITISNFMEFIAIAVVNFTFNLLVLTTSSHVCFITMIKFFCFGELALEFFRISSQYLDLSYTLLLDQDLNRLTVLRCFFKFIVVDIESTRAFLIIMTFQNDYIEVEYTMLLTWAFMNDI